MEEADSLRRFNLLASALAGRTVQVAAGMPGEPAWTDGSLIFLDPATSVRFQLEALAIQASLLAAGSLEPAITRRLNRRSAVARRYLAIEGHRALTTNEDLLPLSVRPLIDRELAARTDSPAASLAAARSREAIADPPMVFGEIRARKLLAFKEKLHTTGQHIPRQQRDQVLAELDDDNAGNAVDMFSSPIGGGGALGRLFQKMLGAVRRLGEGGQPGADTPTHRKRSTPRGGASAVVSNRMAPAVDGAEEETGGTKYPEWDIYRRRYRPDWCTVHEVEPLPTGSTSTGMWGGYGVRRPLARLGLGLDRYHRQPQGDDIDIDAAVEERVELMAGSAPDEAVYVDSLRRRRDLAALLLLDVSGSVAEPGAIGETVHTQQRAAAAALTSALHDLGDRVALYAFHSQGRSAVHLMPVKRFDDNLDALVMRRLSGLKPGAYSRLGAAIRHGAAVLESRGGTPRRLLVVLSDGLAYDHGYERVYGAADAHRALAEARRRGIGCLCLTVGASTNVDDLQRVFGSAAHATIPRLEELGQAIGPLFRSALGSADVRRRVA
ncbi:nitric oxide reductase activation protein NorD [Mycobacterium noviomagense]|uniref:Nitric oxide reductase activation protein n=1 Tax=Mycobacterium noviomagense TaxID=459858 RepID=A0ABX3T927_9MYCO|nr:VWA domain-containing protein [Mycobacterium noviomagense]ORB17156.1 nitric oxide reductase activation protein [Mycobacterium noviomagense]